MKDEQVLGFVGTSVEEQVMKNPVNDMPNHPYWDGKSRQQVYEIMEDFRDDEIALPEDAYDAGRVILDWERRPMFVGDNYRRNTIGRFGVRIGKYRNWIGYGEMNSIKSLGFRVVRTKQ